MIKCGVCGSENEAAALFCGTCGSPLSPGDGNAVADEATKIAVPTTPEPDEEVVPGKARGARRDLGTGGPQTVVPDGASKPKPPEDIADAETTSGGASITCGVCGTVNDATRTYCRKCANELKQAPPPPPPPAPAPVGRKISPLALGLGAGAVVVAIALVAVLAMGGNKPGATLAPSAQVSPSANAPTGAPTTEPSVLPTATARTFTEGEPSGQIAFARCPSDGSDCSIYLRPADLSAAARRIIGASNTSALDPAVSPDGKKIMYVAEPGLRLVTISTGKFTQHSTGAGDTNPAWSEDGSQITFAGHRDRDSGGDDLEIRLDGLKSSSTSRPLTDNDVMDHDPVFTPDGKSIVFVRGEGDERELKMINIESGDVTDLTTDSFADEDPAVSPDGTEVVFSSTRGGTEFDLYVLNLATLEITPLPAMSGDEHDPAWSPGGRYIVFSGGDQGSKDLFILDLADMTTSTFTAAAGSDLTPSWR
ncbi:MAG: zinc ribbon domain-containing protein [Chloroflexota bacterium]